MNQYRNLDLTAVKKLAQALAETLRKRGAVIGLIGPLGSGKTTFTKAFARSLGIKKITSPTFVITHEHPIRQGRLYHLDFYRLNKAKQLFVLGLTEMRQHKNLVLIEWVDRFPEIMQQCDIIISFKVKPENKRDVTIKTKK